MFQHHRVQGEDVRLVVLPRYTQAAVAAWERFMASESIFGLDVETKAIPFFDGPRKGAFGPALSRASYVVPDDLPQSVYNRGYVAGERRDVQVRTIQLGTRTEGWVLPYDDVRWRRRVASFLANEAKRFASHNASFDAVRVYHAYAVDILPRSIDTLPMAKLIWPGRTSPFGGAGLKEGVEWCLEDGLLAQSERDLHALFGDLYGARTAKLPKSFQPGVSPCRNCKDGPSWIGSKRGFCEECYRGVTPTQAAIEWGWDNVEVTDPVFTAYAGLDAVYVRRWLDWLGAELGRRKMNRLSRTEQRVKRLCTASQQRGMRVDLDWTTGLIDEVGAEFNAAQDRVLDLTGLKARSPKMRGWLHEHSDGKLRTRSLDKDHLPALVDRFGDHPEVGPVLHGLRTVQTHANLMTNLVKIRQNAIGGEGRAYPNINTQQAHTGRMSYTGLALQTLAKSGLKGERLRGCLIADDGYVLVGADYDNQEIRIGAALSADEMLLRIVWENLNQHVMTTRSIFGDAFIDKVQCPDMYHKGKTLDFAQQYGAGPAKIALQLGIEKREATELWLKWRETYSGLVDWSERASQHRWVRNPFGRLIPADPNRMYANGNYLIQSTGRDVLGQAMCNLEDAGFGPNIWMLVHDEIILQVPEELGDRAAERLGECMTMDVTGKVTVPITATGEVIGKRWRGLA